MSSILILVRSQYSAVPTMEAIREFHEATWKELKAVRGFEDAQVWVDAAAHERHLIIYRYASVAAAEAGLKVVAKDRILTRSQAVQSQPADVMRMRILREYGQLKTHLSESKIISLSVRVAEPGYAKELQEDLERVFQECIAIDGFRGYLIGVNDSLEEEVIGLASWDTEAAFQSSIPKTAHPDVSHYQRAW